MIRVYISQDNGLRELDVQTSSALPKETVWIDLFQPNPLEKQLVEHFLGIVIPSHEETLEIEHSSRLYQSKEAVYMTAMLVWREDTLEPESLVTTFILIRDKLITLRYGEVQYFNSFANGEQRRQMGGYTGSTVLLGLLETSVDKIADSLEKITRSIEIISRCIFNGAPHEGDMLHQPDFKSVIRQVGKNGEVVSKIRESLVSINRLTGFFTQTVVPSSIATYMKRINTLTKDIGSLSDHATFLSNKVNFLLDATLGMINIEQNAIIKIFSIASVVLLPPTLIASIYGMNFKYIPELDWKLGYPLAIILMFLSAYLPYRFFKKKGWL